MISSSEKAQRLHLSCCKPDGGDLLAVPDRHPGPWLHKGGETLGEDFPRAFGIAAGEFANSEDKLDTTTRTGRVTQGPAIVAMDRR
jgi:hypothetical protein